MFDGCAVCGKDLFVHDGETGEDLSCIVCGTDRSKVIHNIEETMESFLKLTDELDTVEWMRDVDYQEEPVPYAELDHDYHKHPFYIFCEYHYVCPECWLVQRHLSQEDLRLQPDHGDGSQHVYNAYTEPDDYNGELGSYEEGMIDGDKIKKRLVEHLKDSYDLEEIPEDLTHDIEETSEEMHGKEAILCEVSTVDHREDYIRFLPSCDSPLQ